MIIDMYVYQRWLKSAQNGFLLMPVVIKKNNFRNEKILHKLEI